MARSRNRRMIHNQVRFIFIVCFPILSMKFDTD